MWMEKLKKDIDTSSVWNDNCKENILQVPQILLGSEMRKYSEFQINQLSQGNIKLLF